MITNLRISRIGNKRQVAVTIYIGNEKKKRRTKQKHNVITLINIIQALFLLYHFKEVEALLGKVIFKEEVFCSFERA